MKAPKTTPASIGAGLVSALLIAALSMTACSNDPTGDEAPQPKLKTVTAILPQNPGTRVGMEYDNTNDLIKVTWAADDYITGADRITYSITIDEVTGTATFGIPEDTPNNAPFTYSGPNVGQAQSSDGDYAHLPDAHFMTGIYNETTETITFVHTVSVLRIALSGLKKDAKLATLSIGNYSLNLGGNNSTSAEGTFVAWLSMPDYASVQTFTLYYDGYSDSQTYNHGSQLTVPAGRLLHCTINMETKVGSVTIADKAVWEKPGYVVPGYDHVVYDEASFLAIEELPIGSKVIQVADIELGNGTNFAFNGTYNGNGYTISGSSGYAFTTITGNIVNVHVRIGIGLASMASSASIFKCSASGSTMVNSATNTPSAFTLCSTDQGKLVETDGNALYAACRFASGNLSTAQNGLVWNKITQMMVEVPASELFNGDGSINWDYEYVPTP